jgi:glucose-6-phosphate 1-dehydrogenase
MNNACEIKGMDTNNLLVLFGVTSNLAKKKILPALHQLYKNGCFKKKLKVVGISRNDWSDEELRQYIQDILKLKKDENDFLNLFQFVSANLKDVKSLKNLKKTLKKIDPDQQMVKNFYLVIPPHLLSEALDSFVESGITKAFKKKKIILEKPFGQSKQDAYQIEKKLAQLLKEEEVYLLDHYFAKNMMQNVLAFRFANNLFEDSWDKKGVSKIRIRLLETEKVGDRANFYDKLGALRDVGQNHLLQMLALATMPQPKSYENKDLRESRYEIFNSLKPMTAANIIKNTQRGQYKDYCELKNVDKNSKTETYFKITTKLDHPRWEDVPVILESGKNMSENKKDITIFFKHRNPCLCPDEAKYENIIKFTIQPTEKEGITISFWTKKPGIDWEVERQELKYHIEQEISQDYMSEYAFLILDFLRGRQLLFVSSKESKKMWDFVDPILKVWGKDKVPLKIY